MINVGVYINPDGKVYGVKADNHGDELVCAAVSALVLNAANSIELLTNEEFDCELNENGGYLKLKLVDAPAHDAGLLLDSLYLGLSSIAGEYPKELVIKEIRSNE